MNEMPVDLPPWIVVYKHSGREGRLGQRLTKFDPEGLLAPEEVQADVQAMLGAQRVVFELPDAGGARVTLHDCVKVALGQSPRIPRPAGDELIVTARPLGPPAAA